MPLLSNMEFDRYLIVGVTKGKRFATGSGTLPVTNQSATLTVNNLGFTPSKVIVSYNGSPPGYPSYYRSGIIIGSAMQDINYYGGVGNKVFVMSCHIDGSILNSSYDRSVNGIGSTFLNTNGFSITLVSETTISYTWWAYE